MGITMLSTSYCVKCKSLKPQLYILCEELGIELQCLDAMESTEGRNLVSKYNLSQVPVLFVTNNAGGMKMFCGDISLSAVREYLES